mgnify:CR=1 FL=1
MEMIVAPVQGGRRRVTSAAPQAYGQGPARWSLLQRRRYSLSPRPSRAPALDWPPVPDGAFVTLSPDPREVEECRADLEHLLVEMSRVTAEDVAKPASFFLRATLLVSLFFHVLLFTALLQAKTDVTADIAGSGAVTVMLVGDMDFDATSAGKIETKPEPQQKQAQTDDVTPLATTSTDAEVVEEVTAEAAAPVPVMQEAVSEPIPPADAPSVTSSAPEILTSAQAGDIVEAVAIPQESLETTADIVQTTSQMTQVEEAEVQPIPRQQAVTTKVTEPLRRPAKSIAVKADPRAQPKQKSLRSPTNGNAGQSNADARKGAVSSAEQQVSSQPGNAAVSNYPGKIVSKLRRALTYPRSALGERQAGEARVSFTVQSDGRATSIHLARSSGSDALDQSALEAVRRASPFPPIPVDAGRTQWSFSVPVAFTR